MAVLTIEQTSGHRLVVYWNPCAPTTSGSLAEATMKRTHASPHCCSFHIDTTIPSSSASVRLQIDYYG
jgi:hypothetical protein